MRRDELPYVPHGHLYQQPVMSLVKPTPKVKGGDDMYVPSSQRNMTFGWPIFITEAHATLPTRKVLLKSSDVEVSTPDLISNAQPPSLAELSTKVLDRSTREPITTEKMPPPPPCGQIDGWA